MITLNDYLFDGNTVLKILLQYSSDLKDSAIKSNNPIDLAHSNFLIQIIGFSSITTSYLPRLTV